MTALCTVWKILIDKCILKEFGVFLKNIKLPKA